MKGKSMAFMAVMVLSVTAMAGFAIIKDSDDSLALVSGDWEYTASGNKAIITSYNGSASDITVPSMLDGIPVTTLGGGETSVFDEKRTSVVIPDSVVSIGNRAFRDCWALTSVTIPDSVVSIGNSAFLRCRALTSVTIPDSVVHTANDNSFGMFSYCSNLKTATIGTGCTNIGVDWFFKCLRLDSVTIPDTVGKISARAFGDTAIPSLVLPHTVGDIASNAFPATTDIKYKIMASAPSNKTPVVNSNWGYTPTDLAGVKITVQGADWLTSAGSSVFGAPSESGTYDVTLTISKTGYVTTVLNFALVVSSELVVINSPTNGMIIYEV